MIEALRDMVKGQSGPCLAVEFRADEIALFALEDQASGGVGWAETHAVAVDAPDLNEQAAAMRAAASARSGAERPGVDIWLPREQIATIDLAPGDQTPRAAALAALTQNTNLGEDELIVDVTATGEGARIAASAVERIVVEEARAYAERWGFAPLRITTRHGHKAFAAGPTFAAPPRKAVPRGALAGVAALIALAVGLGAAAFLGGGQEDIQIEPEAVVAESPVTPAPTPSVENAEDALQTPSSPAPPTVAAPSGPVDSASKDVSQTPAAPPERADEGGAPPRLAGAAALEGRPVQSGERAAAAQPMRPAEGLRFEAPAAPDIAVVAIPQLRDAPAAMALRLTPPRAAIGAATTDAPPGGAAPLGQIVLASLGDALTAPNAKSEAPTVDAAALTPTEEEVADLPASAPPPRPDRGAEDGASQEPPATSEDRPERRELRVTSDPRRDQQAPAQSPLADPAPDDETAGAEDARTAETDQAQANETDEAEAPGPGAVGAAPIPSPRPEALDMTPSTLAALSAPTPGPRPKSIRARLSKEVRGSAQTVPRASRSRPAGPGVANAATLKDAIELSAMNLLGVFGKQGSRRALLRLPSGEVMRVSRGAVVDGWVVARIDKTSMRITRGGEAQTLNVLR